MRSFARDCAGRIDKYSDSSTKNVEMHKWRYDRVNDNYKACLDSGISLSDIINTGFV